MKLFNIYSKIFLDISEETRGRIKLEKKIREDIDVTKQLKEQFKDYFKDSSFSCCRFGQPKISLKKDLDLKKQEQLSNEYDKIVTKKEELRKGLAEYRDITKELQKKIPNHFKDSPNSFFSSSREKKPTILLKEKLTAKDKAKFIAEYHEILCDNFDKIKILKESLSKNPDSEAPYFQKESTKIEELEKKFFKELKILDQEVNKILDANSKELNEELFDISSQKYPTHTILGKDASLSRKKYTRPFDEKSKHSDSKAMTGEELLKIDLLRQLSSPENNKEFLKTIFLKIDKDEDFKFSPQDLEIFIKSELDKSTKSKYSLSDRDENEKSLLVTLKESLNRPDEKGQNLLKLIEEREEVLKEKNKIKEILREKNKIKEMPREKSKIKEKLKSTNNKIYKVVIPADYFVDPDISTQHKPPHLNLQPLMSNDKPSPEPDRIKEFIQFFEGLIKPLNK